MWALSIQEGLVKQSIFLAITTLFCACISFSSARRYGCFDGICIDFPTTNWTGILFGGAAVVLGTFALTRLLRVTDLTNHNAYDSKNLSDLDV